MILNEIAAKTAARIAEKKKKFPEHALRERAEALAAAERVAGGFAYPFERALARDGISFICEVKKASPSKGIIAADFPYRQIAADYAAAGADALSVLTEPFYFQGQDAYLQEIAASVALPALRKDFTVDAYMLYEAKALGASAVLLICAILTDRQLETYFRIADGLGLSALVEAHTEEEVRRALGCGARVVGVNNRDLKTFAVDIRTSERLRSLVPRGTLYVSESGIRTPADVARLKENGTDGVLIGETLMRQADKKRALAALRGE